jgi:hypothetical protein
LSRKIIFFILFKDQMRAYNGRTIGHHTLEVASNLICADESKPPGRDARSESLSTTSVVSARLPVLDQSLLVELLLESRNKAKGLNNA